MKRKFIIIAVISAAALALIASAAFIFIENSKGIEIAEFESAYNKLLGSESRQLDFDLDNTHEENIYTSSHDFGTVTCITNRWGVITSLAYEMNFRYSTLKDMETFEGLAEYFGGEKEYDEFSTQTKIAWIYLFDISYMIEAANEDCQEDTWRMVLEYMLIPDKESEFDQESLSYEYEIAELEDSGNAIFKLILK